MRKRGGNFLKKAMAVLLSVVLCVGLAVGAEPVEVQAADTQTARLIVRVVGMNSDLTAIRSANLSMPYRNGTLVRVINGRVSSDEIIYTASGLECNTDYSWSVNGYRVWSFNSDQAEEEKQIDFYPVYFKVDGVTWKTDYVPYNNIVRRPNTNPTKTDCTFVDWYYAGRVYNFNTRIWYEVNLNARWKWDVTENTLRNKLQEIVNKLSVSNDTTREDVEEAIRKEIDKHFEIESSVILTTFNPTYATSENEGSLKLNVTVEGEGVSIDESIDLVIPQLPPILDRGWTLDETGKLTITSQEGMNDWAQSGRLEDDNVSDVKNIVIQDGVTEIPANAFGGCDNLKDVSIPNTVTGIGDSAFADSPALSEVTLPPGLNSIGNGAFSGCSSLEKVVMQGETPPSIGDSVFEGCKFVEEPENTEGIVVPSGSGDAYKGSVGGGFGENIKEQPPEFTQEALDKKLKEILDNLPASNDITMNDVEDDVKKAIDEYFQIDSTVQPGMLGITKATIREEGLILLDVTVSYGGVSVKKEVRKTIPKLSAESDRGWTLDEAGNLTITSQEGMENWAQNGRTEGDNLSDVKSVVIQDGVTEIPDNAFDGCSNLDTVTIPDTVTSIGDSAFADASSLGEVTLPPNLESIENGAFSGCSALDRVVMQGTEPPEMGDSVFDGCKFVEDNTEGIVVPEGSEGKYKDKWEAALGEYILEKLPTVTEEALSEKLQEIFDGLPASNETTPESIIEKVKETIDSYFQIASTVRIADFELTEATSDSEGALKLAVTAKCGDNCFAQVAGIIPIAMLPPAPDRGWALDDAGNLMIKSQAGMNDWAQNGKSETGASTIRGVVIQGDVTAIPASAFRECNNLNSVTIPESVTDIGSLAFAFNSSLSAITLPQGLKSIGDMAFLGCDSLEKVVMRGSTPPSIGQYAFDQCKFVTDSVGGIIIPIESEDTYRVELGDLEKYITVKHYNHVYGGEWRHNNTKHWHECICGAQADVAAHEWDGGSIITEPTATGEGSKIFICSVCGAEKKETIPATGIPSTSGNSNQGGGTPSASGNGNQGGGIPSASGNGNQGGDIPSASGNGNQGVDIPSVSGNGNQGADIPSVSGNGSQGSGIPSTPGNGNQGSGSDTPDKDKYQPPEINIGVGDNTSQWGSSNNTGNIFQNANTSAAANTSWTPEPKTGDGISTRMYATIAMILGFTYLILLFSERHGMTEETKKELLSRLIGWTKNGSKLRRMLALAGIFLLMAYYHSIGKQVTEEKETSLTV